MLRFFLLSAALTGLASAFPPAPAFTYHGTGRDSFGNALGNDDNLKLLLKRGSETIAQAPIKEGLHDGENFRLLAPMDLSQTDRYTASAVSQNEVLFFQVLYPNGTTAPISGFSPSVNTVGKPGDSLRFDFTIGVDSDGDGIPDDWELFQLDEAGHNPGDDLYSLDTFGDGDFDKNGVSDFQEYLSGTFAFLNADYFRLKVTGLDEDNYLDLILQTKFGRKYRFEKTYDMITWLPTAVCEPEDRSNTILEVLAEESGPLSLEVPPDSTEEKPVLMIRASVR